MVFHPKEEILQRRRDRLNTLDRGGIAIDQGEESAKVPRRSVPGRRIMAGTRAMLAKMQAAYGYWRPLPSCSSLLRQRSDCSWFNFIPRSCMARAWDTTKAVIKDKMSAVVKKALRSI
jgi:hypothetical protein